MNRPQLHELCQAEIAPGIRCEHLVEDHLLHGPSLLECWRCEDWHHFILKRHRPPQRRAA